jgi:hypothetical protein
MAGVAGAGTHPGFQLVLRCPVASAGFRAGLTAVGTAVIAAARWRRAANRTVALPRSCGCGGVSAPAPTPPATRCCVQPRHYRRQEPFGKTTVRPVSMASCPKASQKCLCLCRTRRRRTGSRAGRFRGVRKFIHAARRYSCGRPPSRSHRCARPSRVSWMASQPAGGSGDPSRSARCGRCTL